jgi:hypothetical protein
MIIILPVSLLAQDNAAAILHTTGAGVMVNRNPAPASSALFPDDLIETEKAAVARIDVNGSTADLDAETMVQFEGNELVLDHGSLSVNTSRGLKVRVGCLTITPALEAEWTHYDVIDVDGRVTVSALKSDVTIEARSSNLQQAKEPRQSDRATVREGERKSREEKCGAAYRPPSGPTAGAIMNSPWAIGAGFAGIGVIVCLGLLCRNDDPMSPTKP